MPSQTNGKKKWKKVTLFCCCWDSKKKKCYEAFYVLSEKSLFQTRYWVKNKASGSYEVWPTQTRLTSMYNLLEFHKIVTGSPYCKTKPEVAPSSTPSPQSIEERMLCRKGKLQLQIWKHVMPISYLLWLSLNVKNIHFDTEIALYLFLFNNYTPICCLQFW